MLGSFENDNPYVEVELNGVATDKIKVKALVDSGYNGYLTLPYIQAFPLGLILTGVQSSTLADGSISHHFVCIGSVTYDSKTVATTIDIQPNCNVLLGTKLLRLLGKTLIVDPVNNKVELINSPTPTPPEQLSEK